MCYIGGKFKGRICVSLEENLKEEFVFHWRKILRYDLCYIRGKSKGRIWIKNSKGRIWSELDDNLRTEFGIYQRTI